MKGLRLRAVSSGSVGPGMINTEAFRKRVNDHIEQARARHAEQLVEWEKFVQADKDAWIAEHGEEWRKFARSVSRNLTAGKPIERSHVPSKKDRWNHRDTLTWEEPSTSENGLRRPEKEYRVPNILNRLLQALDLLNEEEISPTALARVGMRQAEMAEVSAILSRRY